MDIKQEATATPMVPKPNSKAYINFVQAFRNSYQGSQPKPLDMVRMAAEAWRNLSEEDKQPFKAMAETEKAKEKPRQKDPKRLGTLRPRPRKVENKASHVTRPARKTAVKKVKFAAAKRNAKSSRPKPSKNPRRKSPRRKAPKRKAPKRRSYSLASDSTQCECPSCSCWY